MSKLLETIQKNALDGLGATEAEAIEIANIPEAELFTLLSITDEVRRKFKGMEVNLCGIVNAKSGLCKEDCTFCSQSTKYETDAKEYPMVSADDIVAAAERAEAGGAREFSIVTSGTTVSQERDVEILTTALKTMDESTSLERCASLGILDDKTLKELKDAGLESYHHNLETSRSYFPEICTTHDYEDDVNTIKRAKAMGFYTCSGGIFGLGESWADRVELAMTLRELDTDCVPINFLNPRPGTPLADSNELTPIDCIKIIALFRLILPTKDIIVCGGRDKNLGQLQPLIFSAGANGMMVGDYLTTKGRAYEDDLRMLEELGLKPRK